jgi:hypothetical protein
MPVVPRFEVVLKGRDFGRAEHHPKSLRFQPLVVQTDPPPPTLTQISSVVYYSLTSLVPRQTRSKLDPLGQPFRISTAETPHSWKGTVACLVNAVRNSALP